MDITSKELQEAFARIAKGAQEAREELCDADAKVGDGDLGLTVADGFVACAALSLPSDLGQAFFEASKAFQRASPSSFGTLIATGFMAAAKALKGRDRMALSEVAGFLALARDAMLQRGKSSLGDKTGRESIPLISPLRRQRTRWSGSRERKTAWGAPGCSRRKRWARMIRGNWPYCGSRKPCDSRTPCLVHRPKRRLQPEFGKVMHKQRSSAPVDEPFDCVGALARGLVVAKRPDGFVVAKRPDGSLVFDSIP
jgi:hypothetical protein